MRSTFKVLFYLKRDKEKKNGNVPLFCRITVDGKETRFGMKQDVNPKFWDVEAGKASGRTNEATDINLLVDRTKAAIYKVYRDLQERDSQVTAEKVKNAFLGINSHQNLLEIFTEHNGEKKQLADAGSISQSLYDKYRITCNHLSAFMKDRYSLTDISMKDIDRKFIDDFKLWLLTVRRCSDNTTVSYLKLFKHIILVAIDSKRLYSNPFTGYPLELKPRNRGYLTQEEVEILMKRNLPRKSLERVRDMFIFCCFTGLSYIDVRNLTEDKIGISFDSKPWITGKRGKTDLVYTVPLL